MPHSIFFTKSSHAILGTNSVNRLGDPVVITPQGQRAYPQARADDGYVYPSDGSSTEQRYPSPGRRVYGAQAYPQQQYYYGNGGTYQPAPQGYYQPRPYYQQRGLYQD